MSGTGYGIRLSGSRLPMSGFLIHQVEQPCLEPYDLCFQINDLAFSNSGPVLGFELLNPDRLEVSFQLPVVLGELFVAPDLFFCALCSLLQRTAPR